MIANQVIANQVIANQVIANQVITNQVITNNTLQQGWSPAVEEDGTIRTSFKRFRRDESKSRAARVW